jgi:acyl-coenzyme A thioesterase PaaI-like protein
LTENGSAPGPERIPRQLTGRAAASGDPALNARRAAIGELGAALRELAAQAVATEAGEADLREVAAQVRTAAAVLGRITRGRFELPSADEMFGGVRLYNPVIGSGSPFAPPLQVERDGTRVTGTCTLSLAYEGPPTFAHGGVSAMLLDQILGHAAVAAGHPGMTVQLDTSYRKPVPLQTPLLLTAELTETRGRRVTVRGAIATAAEPGTVLVEATGIFVQIRPEVAARLFRGVAPAAADPAVAHD